MFNPLQGPTIQNFSRALLLGGIEQQFNSKAKVEIARVLTTADAKTKVVDGEIKRYQDLRTQIGGAETTIADTLTRLKRIRDALDAMTGTAIDAGRDPDLATAIDGYRSTFDNQIDAISSAANRSFYSPNLLAETGGFSLSFRTTLFGTTFNVANAFMGTSYRLVEADGDIWVPDHGANLIAQRGSDGEEIVGTAYSTASAIRLDALVGQVATLTLGGDTAASETITATVETTGLGVKESWYYNGLNDADGRDRAIADLDRARISIDLEIRRYETAETVIGRYAARAQGSMDELREERLALIRERELETNRIQTRIQRELNAVSQTIGYADSLNASYRNLLNQYTVKPGTFGRVVGRTPSARLFAALLNIRA